MIPDIIVEDKDLSEIINKAIKSTNIHNDNSAQEILEKVFESVSRTKGIEIKYPSQTEVLAEIHNLGVKELQYHQAINSKMLSFLFESLMSKAIMALGRFIESYISRVDETLYNEPNMQTVVGSLRSLFDLMEQMEKMKNRNALKDPDRVLSPQTSAKIDREKIDMLRREINDISN